MKLEKGMKFIAVQSNQFRGWNTGFVNEYVGTGKVMTISEISNSSVSFAEKHGSGYDWLGSTMNISIGVLTLKRLIRDGVFVGAGSLRCPMIEGKI